MQLMQKMMFFYQMDLEVPLQTLLEMEEIRGLLHDLPPNVQSDVCRKLSELGVCQASDMKYLNPEKDLADVLRPIQTRKMMAAISDMFSAQGMSMSGCKGPRPVSLMLLYGGSLESRPVAHNSGLLHGSFACFRCILYIQYSSDTCEWQYQLHVHL